MKLCLGASVLAVGVSLSAGVRAAPLPPAENLDLLRTRARARIANALAEPTDDTEETTVMTIEREILERLDILLPARISIRR